MHIFTILYVKSVEASVSFYQKILGEAPIEFHPTFASFQLTNGHMLGLWIETGVMPKTVGVGARSELCFDVPDRTELEGKFSVWTDAGAEILQGLTKMDFGDTFTAADPDGHRLRVMVSAAP